MGKVDIYFDVLLNLYSDGVRKTLEKTCNSNNLMRSVTSRYSGAQDLRIIITRHSEKT